MGLETRNGRSCFYRKVREGDRVRSVYVAGGETAISCVRMDAQAREEEAAAAAAELAELAGLAEEDARVAAYLDGAGRAVEEGLLASGLHRPSRKLEWMRCHGKRR